MQRYNSPFLGLLAVLGMTGWLLATQGLCGGSEVVPGNILRALPRTRPVILRPRPPVNGPATNPTTAPLAPEDIEAQKKAAQIIPRLSSDDFATREEAVRQLKDLGPGILPLLSQHTGDADAEAAQRVQSVIDSYAWLRTGAMLIIVEPDSREAKAGLKLGDVILRMGGKPVTNARDLANQLPGRPLTYDIWHEGRLLMNVQVPAGFPVPEVEVWTAEHGGHDMARGIGLMGSPATYGQALEALAAARQAGMQSYRSLTILAGLYEYQLDHAHAMEVYREQMAAHDICALSHDLNYDYAYQGVPVANARTAWLLQRVQKAGEDQLDPELVHELDAWLTNAGRNYPLLLRYESKVKWPADAERSYTEWRFRTRQRLEPLAAQWQWVVDDGPHMPGQVLVPLAVAARLQLGQVTGACETAGEALKARRPGVSARPDDTGAALMAWAAATVGGHEKEAATLGEVLSGLALRELRGGLYEAALLDRDAPAVRVTLAPWMRRAYEGNDPEFSDRNYLEWMLAQPGLTAEQWDKAWEHEGKLNRQRNEFWSYLHVAALERLGRLEDLRKYVARARPFDRDAIQPVLDFYQHQEAAASKPGHVLFGAGSAVPARQPGEYWVGFFDGRVLYVDAQGKSKSYPGLPERLGMQSVGQAPWARYAEDGTVSVVYSFDNTAPRYVLDPKANRWVDSRTLEHPTLYDHKVIVAWNRARGAAQRILGCAPRFPQIRRHGPLAEDWYGVWFEGDLALAVNTNTFEVKDLSALIAALAKRSAPAHVYQPAPGTTPEPGFLPLPSRVLKPTIRPTGGPSIGPVPSLAAYRGPVLLGTDCGLWKFDPATAALQRVELPLANQDVSVAFLDFPKTAGKLFVGVVPQDGGQVIEVDREKLTATMTKGYCGIGPDDIYCDKTNGEIPPSCWSGLESIFTPSAATKPATSSSP